MPLQVGLPLKLLKILRINFKCAVYKYQLSIALLTSFSNKIVFCTAITYRYINMMIFDIKNIEASN